MPQTGTEKRGLYVVETDDREAKELVLISEMLEEGALERAGEVMEGWLFRRFGLASTHRPGLDEDGREARAVIEAVLEGDGA